MAAGLLKNRSGIYAGIYARGIGSVQSVWHQSFTHVPVLDKRSLELSDIPEWIIPEVYMLAPLDPETLDPCVGLSIIKSRALDSEQSFPGRLGQAGGAKRTSWTPCQPADVLRVTMRFQEVGATVESVMWLEPGKFLVDGSLPCDASLFGSDQHEVRFLAIANYSGGGSDCIVISLVRTVCANTERLAVLNASKSGSILKVRHSANVADAWELDVPRFVGHYSAKVAEHATKKRQLAEMILGQTAEAIRTARDAYFVSVLGTEPEKGRANTTYRWKLNALKRAYMVERENAATVGLNPDSMRVAYEAVTNVLSNGGMVEGPKGQEWRPLLNGGHSEGARAFALTTGNASTRALTLALSAN